MTRRLIRYLWSALVVAVLSWVLAPLAGFALLLALIGV